MKSKLSCHLMLPVPKSQPQKFVGKTFCDLLQIRIDWNTLQTKKKDIVLLGSML